MISCNYGIGGNYVGAKIYTTGELASLCPDGDDDGLCLPPPENGGGGGGEPPPGEDSGGNGEQPPGGDGGGDGDENGEESPPSGDGKRKLASEIITLLFHSADPRGIT